MKMLFRVRPVGPWQMNAHVLVCPAGMQSVLIDPGADPGALEARWRAPARSPSCSPTPTPTTSARCGNWRPRLRVPVMAHPAFAGGPLDRPLEEGGTIAVGEHRLKVHHAPGHTPDQVCFAVEDDERIVVGDTLFEGGPGKTWSPEDFQTTLETLRRVVLSWPDGTRCYPGHGDPFRLGGIRSAVETFIAKDHGPFCGDATWGM